MICKDSVERAAETQRRFKGIHVLQHTQAKTREGRGDRPVRSLLRGREETPHPPAPRGRSTSSHASFPAGPTAGLTLPAAPAYHPVRPLPGFGPAGLPEEFPARPPPPPRPSRRAVRSLGSEIGAPHGRETHEKQPRGEAVQGGGPRPTPPFARNPSPRPPAKPRPSRARANGPRPPPGR